MDKISKDILSRIASSEDQAIYYQGVDEPFADIATSGHIDASIKYLSEHGYIDVMYDDGRICKISISHKTAHPFRHILRAIVVYLSKNWIAIVALIISIIALGQQ